MFERSKLESLRDVSVNRIGDTFPTVFRRVGVSDEEMNCELFVFFIKFVKRK